MQHEEAITQLQASLDLALARPGCMAVVSPHALAVVLDEHRTKQTGEPDDAT